MIAHAKSAAQESAAAYCLPPISATVMPTSAPAEVIASHITNGAVDRTRPLCPYPQEAQWKGAGSTDDAANFVCAVPKQ